MAKEPRPAWDMDLGPFQAGHRTVGARLKSTSAATCSDGRRDQALDGATEIGAGAGDHPVQDDEPAATEQRNRAQEWRLLAEPRREADVANCALRVHSRPIAAVGSDDSGVLRC